MNYWTAKEDQLIRQYYHQKSEEERQQQIIHLLPAISVMVRKALRSFKNDLIVTPDNEQDVTIHLITKSLAGLKEDKLQGQLQFLYRSATNFIISTYFSGKKNKPIEQDYESQYVGQYPVKIEEETFDPEQDQIDNENKQDIRQRVIKELDFRINQQRVLNTTNVQFLLLFKSYLIENDFEPSGFREFACDKMDMNIYKFRSIASRLGIKTEWLK